MHNLENREKNTTSANSTPDTKELTEIMEAENMLIAYIFFFLNMFQLGTELL